MKDKIEDILIFVRGCCATLIGTLIIFPFSFLMGVLLGEQGSKVWPMWQMAQWGQNSGVFVVKQTYYNLSTVIGLACVLIMGLLIGAYIGWTP